MSRSRRLTRRALAGMLFVLLGGLIALVGVSHVAPLLGYNIFIVRGASMTPTIPLGSLVGARTTSEITPGDVVTFRLPTGTVVTHRVVEVVDEPDGTYLQTKGDANRLPDPDLVPASSVVGVVDAYAPIAGYVLALLSIPTGLVSVVSMLAALLLGVWIIDDQAADVRRRRETIPPRLAPGAIGETAS